MITRMKFGVCADSQSVEQSERILAPVRSVLPGVSAELVTTSAAGEAFSTAADLMQALLEKRVDFAICPLNQIPVELPAELTLPVFARRTTPRYGLVLAENTKKLPKTKPIGCRNRLQQLQLREQYPKQEILLLEESPAACLRLFHSGAIGGLVLEEADVEALDLMPRVLRWFTPQELVPAPGSGILAVQTRRGTDCSCLKTAGDLDTAYCALTERSFLGASKGNPALTGAYGRIEDGMLILTAVLADPEGNLKKGDIFGNPQQAGMLGEMLAAHFE